MSGTRILLCFACLIATINSCLVPDKKGDQEVHIFHIGSPDTKQTNEPDIIKLHIPDARKKREIPAVDVEKPIISCRKDRDCPLDSKCSSETSKCYDIASSSVQSSNILDSTNLDGEEFDYTE